MGRCLGTAGVRVAASLALAAAIACAAGAGPANGGEPGAGLVEQLRQSGAAVTPLGRRGAMDGWWVEPSAGEAYALYVDPTGHAVLGTLYAPDGSGVTGVQLEGMRAGRAGAGTVAPALPPSARLAGRTAAAGPEAGAVSLAVSSPAALFEAGAVADGFELGETGPEVVTFADPACGPSRAAVAMLAKRAVNGELRLKVVPVGMLGERSRRLAEAVVASENGALAWFSGDRDRAPAAASGRARAAVDFNERLFLRSGSQFVPWSLLRRDEGAVSAAVGLDVEAWFEAPR